MPTLITSNAADIVAEIQESAKFSIEGVDVEKIRVDKGKLVERVCASIDKDSNSIAPLYDSIKNITLYRTECFFIGPKTLQVGNQVITGDKVFVVSGCRARIPDLPGLHGTPYLTYKEALRLPTTPKSMIVVGGGYVAAELGYYFSKTGTEVQFLVRNRMLTGEDEEIQTEFERVFGLKQKVHMGAIPTHIAYDGKEFTVTVKGIEGTKYLKAEALFIATGVVPNTDNLKVIASDIKTDTRGFIKVNENFETNVPGIYAFGDVTGRHLFRHTANYEGDWVFQHVFKNSPKPFKYPPVPHAVFTNPQIGGVGLTHRDATVAYPCGLVIGRCNYSSVAMGDALMSDHGFCKLIFSKESKVLVGAHIIGQEASNMIHTCIAFMKMGATVDDMWDTIYVHPALPEVVRAAVRNAVGQFTELNA